MSTTTRRKRRHPRKNARNNRTLAGKVQIWSVVSGNLGLQHIGTVRHEAFDPDLLGRILPAGRYSFRFHDGLGNRTGACILAIEGKVKAPPALPNVYQSP